MHVVSIYNNKGGDGKSTLAVGLSEFLAAKLGKKVLLIDLDPLASSSTALLGADAVTRAIGERRTVAAMVEELLRTKKPVQSPQDFYTFRPAWGARGSALRELAVLVPDAPRIIDLEERMKLRTHLLILAEGLRPTLGGFDYVLLDMPGNVTRRNRLVMAGLIMSDFVLVPVVPTNMSLNALGYTFDFVQRTRDEGRIGRPEILGILRNRTDRRAQQYKRYFPEIEAAIAAGRLPPMFGSFLPEAPAFGTATDGTMGFRTLKERFGTYYYDHMRKVSLELNKRCSDRAAGGRPRRWAKGGRLSRIIRAILRRR